MMNLKHLFLGFFIALNMLSFAQQKKDILFTIDNMKIKSIGENNLSKEQDKHR